MKLESGIEGGKESFDEGQLALIARARTALARVDKVFRGVTPDGLRYRYVAGAVIWPAAHGRPVRIDFQAHAPGEIGQAYLGPDTPLTADLFDGDGLAEGFRREIEAAWSAFEDHMGSDTA
jgi:hypothetical protein